MGGPSKGVDWGWFLIIVFVIAAMGGGGFSSCDNTGGSGGGGKNPAPKQSAVCNEYFKGGC